MILFFCKESIHARDKEIPLQAGTYHGIVTLASPSYGGVRIETYRTEMEIPDGCSRGVAVDDLIENAELKFFPDREKATRESVSIIFLSIEPS